jgi:dUTP pyrophosphatase
MMPAVSELRVQVKRLRPDAVVPRAMSAGAAGMDLTAAEGHTLRPGDRAAVPTGLAFAIPDGWEGQVRPRSGLARTHGVTVLNAPGTIDSDYTGEVHVILVNLGTDSVTIQPGERIAQIVFAPVTRAALDVVDELPATARGAGGFGSTGR